MDGRRIGIPVGRASSFMRVVVNGENDDDDAIAEEEESCERIRAFALVNQLTTTTTR